MGLKGIHPVISPQLLKVLAEMGHGDEIVFADLHFPAASIARAHSAELVNLDGHQIPLILTEVLKLFPLDEYSSEPAAVMDLVPSDKEKQLPVPIWDKYQTILDQAEGHHVSIEKVERFAFYERAKRAFAVVSTGDNAQYANIILKKGLVHQESTIDAKKRKLN